MVMIKSIFLAFAELVLFSLSLIDLSVFVSLILKITWTKLPCDFQIISSGWEETMTNNTFHTSEAAHSF